MVHSQDQARKFFATYAKGEAPPKGNSERPRTIFTDKRVFVRSFIASGETKYAFTKRVAKLNRALPKGQRFGCISTTQENVATQLDRVGKQLLGDKVWSRMSRGQK
jgi:hypothetical protein